MSRNHLEPIKTAACFERKITAKAATCGYKNINCYLMADEINKMVQEKNVYYEAIANGLLLYHDNGVFYRLYLFIKGNESFTVYPKDKPIAVELPAYDSGRGKNKWITAALLSSGFKNNAVMRRMTKRTDAYTGTPSIFQVSMAKPEHAAAIRQLWYTLFDPIINYLPSAGLLLDYITQGQVFCVWDENGKLSGAMRATFTLGRGWTWHVAVSPDCQRKHIGQALYGAYFQTALQKNIKTLSAWIIEDNQASLHFHTKLGYRYDGMQTVQYLLS